MKISWKWLNEILPVTINANQAAELLTDIGLEVESVYAYESIKGGLEGLIAGEVMSVVKHPDADKLKITEVNIGNGELLKIVCGAPNVAVGQKVIVAKTGTTIHPIKGEPFTIKKAKIRGEESNGMLCADDEIGLGESHEGLHILPDATIAGNSIKEIFDIYSDTIIEIGLTANHADANSHFGTARELRAGLISREIESPQINDPAKKITLNFPAGASNNSVKVSVEDTKGCIRYSGILIKNIETKASPAWLQNKLKAVGMRPINNVVDITNYILQELGQPLHAFDFDKIKGGEIIIKTLPDNTKFISRDEKERNLSRHDLMICDKEGGMCIAGVYGGINSGITSSTKNIFIESACFNPAYIRATESRHGLKTDASSRFAKGTDPEIIITALQLAAQMLVEFANGEIDGGIIDIYPTPVKPFHISLNYDKLKNIGAIDIPPGKIKSILQSVNIQVIEENDAGLKLEVPSYKNDVTREIDIVEEIMRLYGFNNIPLPSNVRTPYLVSPKPDKERTRLNTISYLVDKGFYEIFTNAISRSKYTEKFLTAEIGNRVNLLNSLNAELDCMRQTMMFTGLEVIGYNSNHKQSDLRLFEIGRVYSKVHGDYIEKERIAIYITGNKFDESWRNKNRPVDLFDLKEIVDQLTKHFNTPVEWVNSSSNSGNDQSILFESGAALVSNGKTIGNAGIIKKDITSDFDIKQNVLFVELDWNMLLENLDSRKVEFTEISKFPEVRRDLALILDPAITYAEIESIAKNEGGPILKEVILFDVYEGEKLEGKKSYAIGLTFFNEERTLTDADVETVMNKLMSKYEKELNAVIRK
ncbi:MAG: phenylalanine--tRNA ligase subunit beta [Chitinophagales bacterium]